MFGSPQRESLKNPVLKGVRLVLEREFRFLVSGFWEVVSEEWFLGSGFWRLVCGKFVVSGKWFLGISFWEVASGEWFLGSFFWGVVKA